MSEAIAALAWPREISPSPLALQDAPTSPLLRLTPDTGNPTRSRQQYGKNRDFIKKLNSKDYLTTLCYDGNPKSMTVIDVTTEEWKEVGRITDISSGTISEYDEFELKD